MGIFSTRCISCKESTKRCIETYQDIDSDDENGMVTGQLYECENMHCEIKRAIKRGVRETHLQQEKQAKTYQTGNTHRYSKGV